MMKKFIISIFIFIFLVSCTIERANNEYKKGNYVKSTKLLLSYLDKNTKKIDKIDENTKKDIANKFSHIIDHYEGISKNSSNPLNILEANKNLIEIYSLVNTREYIKNFETFLDFTNKFDIIEKYENVKRNIQYLFENDIYIDHKKALNYINYLTEIDNNMDRLIQKEYNNRSYYIVKDDIAILKKDLYKKYGIRLYNLGLDEIKNTNSKRKYRVANSYFVEAKKYILNYGNIDFLIKDTEEKGFFKYSIYSNNSKINNIIVKKMSNIGKIEYKKNSDVYINYSDSYSYSINYVDKKVENLIEKKQIGINQYGEKVYKIYKFNKITVVEKERLRLNYHISINGKFLQDFHNDSLIVENNITSVFYEGDVPFNYKNNRGTPVGKEKLVEEAQNKLEDKINYYMNNIVSKLEII